VYCAIRYQIWPWTPSQLATSNYIMSIDSEIEENIEEETVYQMPKEVDMDGMDQDPSLLYWNKRKLTTSMSLNSFKFSHVF
jgi:hypothetical protein